MFLFLFIVFSFWFKQRLCGYCVDSNHSSYVATLFSNCTLDHSPVFCCVCPTIAPATNNDYLMFAPLFLNLCFPISFLFSSSLLFFLLVYSFHFFASPLFLLFFIFASFLLFLPRSVFYVSNFSFSITFFSLLHSFLLVLVLSSFQYYKINLSYNFLITLLKFIIASILILN